jgi:hypothetical protein
MNLSFRRSSYLWALILGSTVFAHAALGADRAEVPLNEFGAPLRDAQGARINYTRDELAAMARDAGHEAAPPPRSAPVGPQGFVGPSGTPMPFWQYAIFGNSVGAGNVIICPTPASGAREIIVGNGNKFWQVLRHSATTGNYDQVFVGPVYSDQPGSSYSTQIKRIAIANVTGDSNLELVVMLADGRIYLYDLTTKAELGYVTTGVRGLEGMALEDLDGDGLAELIVTTYYDLYVFNSAGTLLWKVPNAGGYDVIAGQMDLDPAIEIATTNGMVIDSVTHLSQWTRNGGFGSRLKLAPLPGASYKQLIVSEGWYNIYSYDVAAQLPRWSISAELDIGAIKMVTLTMTEHQR